MSKFTGAIILALTAGIGVFLFTSASDVFFIVANMYMCVALLVAEEPTP
jgi:hypothetical protein